MKGYAMTTSFPGRSYDAVSLLGFGPASQDPLPQAQSGEIVIRYGGWSLQDLYKTPRVVGLIGDSFLIRSQAKPTKDTFPAGIYRVRPFVPGSNGKTFSDQVPLIVSGRMITPAVIAATALILPLLETGEDVLGVGNIRCADRNDHGNMRSSFSLNMYGGRLTLMLLLDVYDYEEEEGVIWMSDCELCA